MLQFPKEYFRKEIKDGFLVSEVIKHVWAAQLVVLQKVIDICEKHHLTYYAYWGTLLGAVRHHGYIPWDDDLDIAMPKDDYIKFLAIAEQELPEEYELLSPYHIDGWTNYFARIITGDRIKMDEEYMAEYYDCPFAIGIDIFPLYYYPRDEQAAEELKTMLSYVGGLTKIEQDKLELIASGGDVNIIQEYNEELAEGLVDLEQLLGFTVDMNRSLVTQLTILYDQLSRIYTAEESDFMTAYPNYISSGYLVEKELLQETMDMPFEGITVKVPAGYDAVLRRGYGDYMVPRKWAAGHEYFYITEQVGLLADSLQSLSILEQSGKDSLKGKVRILSREELDDFGENAKEILPEKWWNKIYFVNEAGEIKRRRVVLYATSLKDILRHNERVIEKLRYVFEVFKENKDVVLWWFPYALDGKSTQPIAGMIEELLEEYKELVKEYQAADFGIYDDTGDVGRVLMMCDAYYGDEGIVYSYFKQTGKPMMVQDYEICE